MVSFEEKVRRKYDQVAPAYDKRWKGYVFSSLSFLKEWMHLAGNEKILDVACGTGVLEELIVKEHPSQSMTGVDISENMLNVAKRKLAAYSSVTFFHAAGTNLPFADDTFDLVVCASSFHYFDDPVSSLQQMKRVLKRGGRLIILDWCRDYLICQLCDLLLKVFDPAHRYCYRQDELVHFLMDANLRILPGYRFKLNLIWGMMTVEAVK